MSWTEAGAVIMAVRSRKYSPHINDDARKYILCAKIFVYCAENL